MIKFFFMNELGVRDKFELGAEESRKICDGKSYVYHVTGRYLIESILTKGLVPLNPAFRNLRDAFIDKFAPEGFSRTNAVYAYPDLSSARDNRGYNFSGSFVNIIIQAEVNPKMVIVTPMWFYSSIGAVIQMKDMPKAERLAKAYWDAGMLLEDYLKLDPADPKRLDTLEAIIPGGIQAELLHVL